MLVYYHKFANKFRVYKAIKLRPFLEFLKKRLFISSNILTFFSFLSGLTAVFFLFENHQFFVIFILISLFFDFIDGAMARIEGKHGEGWIVDMLSDRLVMVAVLAKSLLVLPQALFSPLLISYLLINGFLIFERMFYKREIPAIFGDGYFYLLYIFGLYEWGIYTLFAFLTLKIITVVLQLIPKTSTETTFANLVSVLRPLLAIFALWKFQNAPLILASLIAIIILLDAVDGFIARHMRGKSNYGAFIDILADRAVELIILYTYAYWGLLHYAFPILFTIRGLATDFLRLLNNIYKDENFKEPLSIGKADNRLMRGFYAGVKLAAFCLILIWPKIGLVLMIIALLTNLWRGLPVIFSQRSKILIEKFLGTSR